MYGYNSYESYGYRLKHYFASGLSKVMDLGNFNQINYPRYRIDQEADDFDTDALREDFEVVGNDMRKAIDSYDREYTIR